MTTLDAANLAGPPKVPKFSPEDVVIAVLQERFAKLSAEARCDFVSLFDEKCESQEEYNEIHQTLRELLFPEVLGKVISDAAGDIADAHSLAERKVWISQKLVALRKSKGMKQVELAEASGLPQSHISRLEAGQHSPSFKTLEKLADALGVKVGDIDPANK